MKDGSAESIVNVGRPETAGIITIRRSVLVAGGLTALFLGLLVVWLFHSNAPSAALAAPLPARAADVSTIDERVTRASDALVVPSSPPAPSPRPDPAMIADSGALPVDATPAALQPQPSAQQGPSAAEQLALARQQAADELARTRQQTVADARDADLSVKLDTGE